MDRIVRQLQESMPWLLKDSTRVGLLAALGVVAASAIVLAYLSSTSPVSSPIGSSPHSKAATPRAESKPGTPRSGRKAGTSGSDRGGVALNKDEWKAFKLIKKESVTHDVRRFVFALPSPDMKLGLPIGQHVFVRARDKDGKEFSRPYTPTSLDADIGILELVLKVYASGKMSQFLDKSKIGAKIEFKGPKGRFKYTPGMVESFGMIAGGSGITPMYQVVQAILRNPEDKTQCFLLFTNHTENDILLKEELDEYVAKYPKQFTVRYFLTQHQPGGWTGGVGRITAQDIREFLPNPAGNTMALVCGPLAMCKTMEELLDSVGYPKEKQYRF